MFYHFLKTIFRNIVRNKLYTLINLFGLSSGIAASLILLLYIQHEISFDQFHENKDQIYRIISIGTKTGNIEGRAPFKLAPALKSVFPEIQNSCRIREIEFQIKKGDDYILEDHFIQADTSFFEIFSFDILYGDKNKTLQDDNSIAISDLAADKYFPDANPIGQIIDILYRDKIYHQQVSAVFKSIPKNSHIQADFVLPINTTNWGYENINRQRVSPSFESWASNDFLTYILLPENFIPEQLTNKFPEFIKEKLPNKTFSGQEFSYTYDLQKLKDIHLQSKFINSDVKNKGNLNHIYLFGGIALLILMIAIINYIILSTARSLNRTKEIGLRKVIGASRSNIIKQVLGESLFLSLLSLPFSLMIANAFLPQINNLLGVSISFDIHNNLIAILGLLCICILTGLISGSYIAFYLSGFKPVDVFRSQINLSLRGSLFQKSLIVFQLIIFIGLLICSSVIYNQVVFMNKNEVLGFNKENLISIKAREKKIAANFNSFKAELLASTNIQFVSSSLSSAPTYSTMIQAAITRTHPKTGRKMTYIQSGGLPENTKDMLIFESSNVDYDYIKAMGMNVVAGRTFDKKDQKGYNKIMVNEQFIKEFEVKNPLTKKFKYKIWDAEIVGIVKNYHTHSLAEKIRPVVLYNNTSYMSQIIIKTNGLNTKQTLNYIEKTWKEFFPNTPFEYSFTDAHIEKLYKKEMNLAKLIGSFSIVAILIASLGLFGLSLFIAQKRTKEIVIRKTLGASVMNIIIRLLRQFFTITIVANLLAIPLTYFYMDKWLQNFEYQSMMDYRIFIFTGLSSLVLCLLTVSFHSGKAAIIKPVEALKYE